MAEESSGRIYLMAVMNSTDLALEHFLACTKKLRDGVHYSLGSSWNGGTVHTNSSRT